MKKIDSKTHGILDYATIIFLWLSPSLFSLSPITATFTYILGAIHLALTITTNFEMGLVKIVPLKIHGIVELLVSVSLVAAAFILGNIEGSTSRIYYLIVAAAIFITWLLSDYKTKKNKLNQM